MSELDEFLKITGASEDEALKALISAFAPLQPSALRQNWLRSKDTGNTAPATAEIWQKFEEADFRCVTCGSQLRITLDHIDGDGKNHALSNLQVLCFSCNREKSRKGTGDKDHGLRIYRAAIKLFNESGRFPTNAQIKQRAGVRHIGGVANLIKYLKKRLA